MILRKERKCICLSNNSKLILFQREFLTGFHKRKVERKNRTKEKYAALAKEEKLRSRKEAREERQRLADKNVREMAAMLRGMKVIIINNIN